MSSLWSWYITILTVGFLIGIFWLLQATRKTKAPEKDGEQTLLMDHSYDGIEEYNNPLPRWWLYMFYASIIFAVIYLILYPGLGAWKGTLNWTEVKQLEARQAQAHKRYGPLFSKYAKMSFAEISKNQPKAVEMGKRIFLNTCAACHGSDAGGAPGFPNLTDKDWLYGSTQKKILASITNGRQATMPAWKPILGELGVQQVVNYVLSLSARKHDAALATAGKIKFGQFCSACHGITGHGNQLIGAPNLSDNIWLYGGSPVVITKTVSFGRKGQMPSHKLILSKEKIHLVGAYVYSLSQPHKPTPRGR